LVKEENLLPLVEKLRASQPLEKDNIYLMTAKVVWERIAGTVQNRLLPFMSGTALKDLIERSEKRNKLDRSFFSAILIDDKATFFSKMMYVLSTFLDGKESNEMLSGLINKFSEIGAMFNLMETHRDKFKHADVKLRPRFTLFYQAQRMKDELSLVKAITHKNFEMVFNEATLTDAAKILGVIKQQEHVPLKDYLKTLFDDKSLGFKNFIINNVIKSRRFTYIVKYANPSKARTMMQSKPVLEFILRRIPTEQLDLNFKRTIGNPDALTYEVKLQKLVSLLQGISLENFLGVQQTILKPGQTDRVNGVITETFKQRQRQSQQEKVQKQSILGLYLTVMHMFYKNLININARYFMAFHALERDMASLKLPQVKYGEVGIPLALLEHRLQPGQYRERILKYLNDNRVRYAPMLGYKYRNYFAHITVTEIADKYIQDLTTMPTSYFAIFHYILQRHLPEIIKIYHVKNLPSFYDEQIQRVKTTKTYSRILLHVLNTAFAYNLARYKSLSIEDLFDKNESVEGVSEDAKLEEKPLNK
jgi:hypothetical protein